ncbi:hypothetical protein V1264_012918 [Littorina saxatilis]|uniref:EGF-like domain-containing protein n=1 Tax=Littorina saxatilis TaxID=31220 RepID=A0AAN9BYK0_9CAEN
MEMLCLVTLVSGVHVMNAHDHAPNWDTVHIATPSRDQHNHEVPDIVHLSVRRHCITSRLDCGQHGICAIDHNGRLGCRCFGERRYVWGGERCEIKGEVLPIRSEYIIGLSMGVIVALIVALVVIVTDSYFKCRKKLADRRPGNDTDETSTETEHARSHRITTSPTQRDPVSDTRQSHVLPAYSDAVTVTSFSAVTQAASQTVVKRVRGKEDDVTDDVEHNGTPLPSLTSSSPSSAVTSDILYRDKHFRHNAFEDEEDQSVSTTRENRNRSAAKKHAVSSPNHEDGFSTQTPSAFTLPRLNLSPSGSDLDTRSVSSLACDSTLRQLSDTYYNTSSSSTDTVLSNTSHGRPRTENAKNTKTNRRATTTKPTENTRPHTLAAQSAGPKDNKNKKSRIDLHRPANVPDSTAGSDDQNDRPVSQASADSDRTESAPCPTGLGPSQERTYRVLLMGSLGPEPVFLYEPWRTATAVPPTDSPQTTTKAQPLQTPYGHCRESDRTDTGPTGPSDNLHARANPTEPSSLGAINNSSDQTVMSSSSRGGPRLDYNKKANVTKAEVNSEGLEVNSDGPDNLGRWEGQGLLPSNSRSEGGALPLGFTQTRHKNAVPQSSCHQQRPLFDGETNGDFGHVNRSRLSRASLTRRLTKSDVPTVWRESSGEEALVNSFTGPTGNSQTVLADFRWEESLSERLSDSSSGTLVAGSFSYHYSQSSPSGSDSESELSVFFDEQTDKFVKSPWDSRLSSYRRRHQLRSSTSASDGETKESEGTANQRERHVDPPILVSRLLTGHSQSQGGMRKVKSSPTLNSMGQGITDKNDSADKGIGSERHRLFLTTLVDDIGQPVKNSTCISSKDHSCQSPSADLGQVRAATKGGSDIEEIRENDSDDMQTGQVTKAIAQSSSEVRDETEVCPKTEGPRDLTNHSINFQGKQLQRCGEGTSESETLTSDEIVCKKKHQRRDDAPVDKKVGNSEEVDSEITADEFQSRSCRVGVLLSDSSLQIQSRAPENQLEVIERTCEMDGQEEVEQSLGSDPEQTIISVKF